MPGGQNSPGKDRIGDSMVCIVLEDTGDALMVGHLLWNPLLTDEVRLAWLLPGAGGGGGQCLTEAQSSDPSEGPLPIARSAGRVC